jgi:anti-sigma B factor antagonist
MDEALQVKVVSVVRVAGEVDLASAPELSSRLDALPANGNPVVVDLSEVSFIDSIGLGVLVSTWTRCRESETPTPLCLVVATRDVERLLEVAGLRELFDVFPTLELATAW